MQINFRISEIIAPNVICNGPKFWFADNQKQSLQKLKIIAKANNASEKFIGSKENQ
jgi:hypothetical protein